MIDISDPSAPRVAGEWNTPGNAEEITLSGGHAFIADGPSGLIIVDISNPEAPVGVSAWDTHGYAWDVSVSGGHAYVADGDNGLTVIDISDPLASVGIGHFLPKREQVEFRAVDVVGSLAFLAAGYSGFSIVDISDPANPVERYFKAVDASPGIASKLLEAHLPDVAKQNQTPVLGPQLL